ncbi:uncharacterized protein LOC133799899 [Humulus lupulus]|uniref:uncharacterized protein LOC133799899 n=1 Tax=Humulus lupulus TaxID=3486 RepID=UPI002B410C16|nr:uncharacterized protein LOC133799899 [Humulus lupulus]
MHGFEQVYEMFKKKSPPNFEGKPDPMEAEDWLKSMKAIFQHMYLNDRERISCASLLLKNDARIWWDVIRRTRDLAIMTWNDFVLAFNKKYYSVAVMATRVDEFMTLVQGNRTITECAQQFDRLARFSPEIVSTKAMRI